MPSRRLNRSVTPRSCFQSVKFTVPAADLLEQDRDRYAEPVDAALEIVGVDPADRAVSYAVDAGLLDAGVATNLENSEPTAQDVAVTRAESIQSGYALLLASPAFQRR
jgi:hypothetical protein